MGPANGVRPWVAPLFPHSSAGRSFWLVLVNKIHLKTMTSDKLLNWLSNKLNQRLIDRLLEGHLSHVCNIVEIIPTNEWQLRAFLRWTNEWNGTAVHHRDFFFFRLSDVSRTHLQSGRRRQYTSTSRPINQVGGRIAFNKLHRAPFFFQWNYSEGALLARTPPTDLQHQSASRHT